MSTGDRTWSKKLKLKPQVWLYISKIFNCKDSWGYEIPIIGGISQDLK